MRIRSWVMTASAAPLSPVERDEGPVAGNQVMIEVAGCGVCHTDLGFLDDGVPVRGSLPLTLGHEISGRVVEAGPLAMKWLSRTVVVPAVIPCGGCDLCLLGRGSICRSQIFPGNDIHGGFASHVMVPAPGLCAVPPLEEHPASLAELAVLADAVTTPYQAIRRSRLQQGDVAIFVGAGGVGGFGVQIARALGATVIAIDVDEDRLKLISKHGASFVLDGRGISSKDLRRQVRDYVRRNSLPDVRWKIFETSGTTAGQETAFALLTYGAYLGVVGYTPRDVTVRLSNLMAFDACAEGNWGCLPELYPEALALVLEGKVELRPFVEIHPMSRINDVLDAIRNREIKKRVVLVPDFKWESVACRPASPMS